jgi:hypothetical protein
MRTQGAQARAGGCDQAPPDYHRGRLLHLNRSFDQPPAWRQLNQWQFWRQPTAHVMVHVSARPAHWRRSGLPRRCMPTNSPRLGTIGFDEKGDVTGYESFVW